MTRAEVRIEVATAGDVEAVGTILAHAFPDKFERILGEDGAQVLTEVFRRSPGSLQGTLLARVNGDTAGMIQLGAETHFLGSARAFLAAAHPRYGWLGAGKRLMQVGVLEVPEGIHRRELYIRAIGVRPGFQGLGIGTRLLGEAAVEARARRKTALSLLVLAHNEGAIRLYERFGFALGCRRSSRALQWAVGRGGYHKMVKPL